MIILILKILIILIIIIILITNNDAYNDTNNTNDKTKKWSGTRWERLSKRCMSSPLLFQNTSFFQYNIIVCAVYVTSGDKFTTRLIFFEMVNTEWSTATSRKFGAESRRKCGESVYAGGGSVKSAGGER